MRKKAKDIDAVVAASESARVSGDREQSVALAREAINLAPKDPRGWRCLSMALTHGDIYRFNPGLREQLIADGSIVEAIAAARRVGELGGANHEDFLQIGYCETALGDFASAAISIRHSSDLYLAETRPDVAGNVTSGSPALSPRFFIIGGHKCGTTSLFNYLAMHPLVLPPAVKEVEYFTQPERGLPWFLAHFPRTPDDGKSYVTGEASVANLNSRKVPARMRDFAPDARIFILVRNPAERAISHYQNYRNLGIEQRSLVQALSDELDILGDGKSPPPEEYWKTEQGYLRIGKYAGDVEFWLSVFPREQVQIIPTEELQNQPEDTLGHALDHLGLPAFKFSNFERHHKGRYDNQDQSAIRRRLDEFFAWHNERLFEVLGRRLDWGDDRAVTQVSLVPAASTARVLFAKGQWAEAAAEFQSCLDQAPSHPDRAEWYDRRSTALISVNALEEAVETLKSFDREYPEDARATMGLLRVARQTGNVPAALSLLDDILRRFPLHRERKNWLLQLSQTLMDLKQWQRAEQTYELLATAFPDDSTGVIGLARVAQEQSHFQHAVQLWNIYLQRFPRDGGRRWWLLTFAHLLIREREYGRADDIASQHMAEYPDLPGGIACLARLEQTRGYSAKAIALWEDCLKRFPDHAERHWWLAALSNLLIDLGDLPRADAIVDDMIINYPQDAGGLASLARIETKRRNTEKAAEIWEECLRRFPQHADRRWWRPTLGHLLLGMKQVDRGATQFEKTLEDYPGDPMALAGLARVAFERSQWQRAADLWQQSIDASPHNASRAEWENMRATAQSRLKTSQTA